MHRLLQITTAESGVKEVDGTEHDNSIVDHVQTSGQTWTDDGEIARWRCYVNPVATEAKVGRSKTGRTRSWLSVGVLIADPKPGGTVVFWLRGRYSPFGHVGIYIGYARDERRICVLGDDLNGQVVTTSYHEDRLLVYWRLQSKQPISVPERTLDYLERIPGVAHRLNSLKQACVTAGTVDGINGPITIAAVDDLQASDGLFDLSGKFDVHARNVLQSMISGR
ncbi:hypothetical protein [Longibacter sp.]|jgi:uncharacterized protein (TIGR02594 family)|uniref:hypothetical protein n=1 Tax=Longibacter sp. TaxID=2045415 RepID=UPI003EB958AB